MMEHSTTIFRRFWRLVEILLFFAISVGGFALIGKTSSLGSKAKEKSRTYAAVLSRSSLETVAALYLKSDERQLQQQIPRTVRSGPAHASPDAPSSRPQYLQPCRLLNPVMDEAYAAELKTQLSHGAILRPRSLFQQSPVLLI